MPKNPLPDRIRRAAKRQGLGIEQFRAAHGFPNTTFYGLLRGELPSKMESLKSLRCQLEAAGVPFPRHLLEVA